MATYRWKDILWSMQVPDPNVLGWMDWPSGLLFVNSDIADPEHWLETATVDDPQQLELMQMLTHETLHFLQVATTGYMYRWACEHHRLLVEGWGPLKELIAQWSESPSPKALLAMESQVDDRQRKGLQEHLSLLDRRGPNGISVRHLLEADALVAELRVHYPGLDCGQLLDLLGEQAAGDVYRLAFDLARCRLGEPIAFRYFPLIASLALCADDPPMALDELLDGLARKPAPDILTPIDTAWAVATAEESVSGLIGSSAQVMEGYGQPRHPVYAPAVRAIANACGRGLKIVDYFTERESALEIIATDSIRPTVFRPNKSHQYKILVPPGTKKSEVHTLLILAVLGSHMARGDADEGQEHSGAQWSWLAGLQGHLTGLELQAEQLRRCDIEALKALDPRQQSDQERRRWCARWGHCVLSFDVEDAGPLWVREDVRRFIGALAEAQPAFPVYLDPVRDMGMFMVWFGSLAHPDALQGNSLDIQHPSVVKRLFTAVYAIRALARQLELDATPALQNLLVPYTREQAKALLARMR